LLLVFILLQNKSRNSCHYQEEELYTSIIATVANQSVLVGRRTLARGGSGNWAVIIMGLAGDAWG
jgi:hypothetical protein